jgi:hypothetical protein
MAAMVLALGGLYVLGRRMPQIWEEAAAEVSDSDSDDGDSAEALDAPEQPLLQDPRIPPRPRIGKWQDWSRFRCDPQVARARNVDPELLGVDREVAIANPTRTEPRNTDRDPFEFDYRSGRRNLYTFTRASKDAVRLMDLTQVPNANFAMSDDSEYYRDELRDHALSRVAPPVEGYRQGAPMAPNALEYRPDPNELLLSVAEMRARRHIGALDVEYGLPVPRNQHLPGHIAEPSAGPSTTLSAPQTFVGVRSSEYRHVAPRPNDGAFMA